VEISRGAALLRAHRALLHAALDTPEADAVRARFEETGRSEYLASIERPTDLSAEATAERILGGVTGYVYRAFRRTRPEATEAVLAEFERGARAGLARGLAQARKILEGLEALEPEHARGIERTESLVLEGLERFLRAERGTPPSEPGAAGGS